MRERARVLGIEGSVVTLAPADPEGCAGCGNAGCGGKRGEFYAVNRRGFDLSPGTEVIVDASARKRGAQALLAVGVPAALAWGSWRLLDRFAPATGDGFRALVSFAAVILGAVLAYAISRASPGSLPEIVDIA